jgi:hypothetical protein
MEHRETRELLEKIDSNRCYMNVVRDMCGRGVCIGLGGRNL